MYITDRFPELAPFKSDIDLGMRRYAAKLNELSGGSGSLRDFANAHAYYGFHRTCSGWVYREWAPGADELYLTGDFNLWHWTDTPMTRLENGNWELFLPPDTLHRGSRVMTIVRNGDKLSQHIPLYATRAVQDRYTGSWCCEVWDSDIPYPWTDYGFHCDEPPIIYEAHVGMSGEDYRVASYVEFADNVLPHIKDGGYNTVQLMGVMEHPYYGSAGYQVSSFYAASSRCGFPEELKYLVNRAHSMGIRVLLDLVHSHAVGNTLEGINRFDGTDTQFFHAGARGDHPAWGTKCFDYGKNEVLHFLLSNLKFWLEEYHFDGFRFDGVTSMLYLDHALGTEFRTLSQYYSLNTDIDAINYLRLANVLIREIKFDALTIAEDMSGMPGMCVGVGDGGVGFDYRLGMGLPDMWIRLVKDRRDEDWRMGEIWHELVNRNAATVAYCESHDQALVGDQTLIFRMAAAEMYTGMKRDHHSAVVDRAVALSKLIKLVTISAGGSAYLNFMGNEFGHPEWIDFPSPANSDSFHYCRRQWSLLYDPELKYQYLNAFDRDMIAAVKRYHVLDELFPSLMLIDDGAHVIAFERGELLFVFNFDADRAYESLRVPVSRGRDHEVVFSSDDFCYGGFGRVHHGAYSAFDPHGSALRLYLPPRTCIVLK